ncbi:hypothetical protein ACN9M1_23135 [Ralstonia sp. R-29]|uniref:hypothetical protein n=1 Tax=Ralstonia sp. R-29 TaxID=3404059 RepID=UPI003CEE8C92
MKIKIEIKGDDLPLSIDHAGQAVEDAIRSHMETSLSDGNISATVGGAIEYEIEVVVVSDK